jgi:hypothetical protein
MSGEAPRGTRTAGSVENGRPVATPLDPKIILEFLGVAAGIAAFVTFVGGALLWLRFDELGLPADRAVAMLPRSLLVTVGAHALLAPAIAGLAAVIALYALDDWSWQVLAFLAGIVVLVVTLVLWDVLFELSVGTKLILPIAVALILAALAGVAAYKLCERIIAREHAPMLLTLGVLIVSGVVLVAHVLALPVLPHLVIVMLVTLAGAAVIFATASSNLGRRPVLWIVFLSFLLVGAAVSFARTAN